MFNFVPIKTSYRLFSGKYAWQKILKPCYFWHFSGKKTIFLKNQHEKCTSYFFKSHDRVFIYLYGRPLFLRLKRIVKEILKNAFSSNTVNKILLVIVFYYDCSSWKRAIIHVYVDKLYLEYVRQLPHFCWPIM